MSAGSEARRGAEERAHRPLRVGRDQDEAASGGRAGGGRRRVEADAGRAQVVGEDLAELVIPHLAHVMRTGAEGCHADDRVGGRAPGDLHPGAHRVVEVAGVGLVDEAHRPLGQAAADDQRVARVAQDVDERIADAEHVDRVGPPRRVSHARSPSSRREVPVEEDAEALARRGREGRRIGDDRGGERARAPRPARLAKARQHPAQHHAGRRDVLVEVRDHRLDAHRVVLLVPDVVVGGERHRRVAQLGLAGQLGLRHIGHSDHRHAPAAVDVRLPSRGELRPLDADIRAAPMHAGAALPRARLERAGEIPAHRIRHADVRDDPVAEER